MDESTGTPAPEAFAPETSALAGVPRIAYANAPDYVQEKVPQRRWLVTVDGRSGAGKTHLADLLRAAHPGAQIVHLDDLYRDWDGLTSGLVRARHIAEQWQRHNSSSYLPTHWPGTHARGRTVIVPDRCLIVEGVGSTWVGRKIADAALWLEAERDMRRRRALERDGDAFVPYWLAWELQEDAWFAAHPPRPDVVVPVESVQPA